MNSEEVRLGEEHSLSFDIELPQARTSRTDRSKRWRARTFYRSTWSKEQRLGKRVGIRSRWGSVLAFVGIGEGCRWWGESNAWGGICGAVAGVEGGRGFGARAAATAYASRQPLGKGAIGGEKAMRGEEFRVRLLALKAACRGGSRVWGDRRGHGDVWVWTPSL
jgi:hypothetical protein